MLNIGDHIKVYRIGYSHHGIYCGDDTVIHYSGSSSNLSKGTIIATTLKYFLNGENDFYVVNYPEKAKRFEGEEVVDRAYSRLGEDEYNLIFNNCEHFATWCVTGVSDSEQVNTIAATTVSVAVSYVAINHLISIATTTASTSLARTVAMGALSNPAVNTAIGTSLAKTAMVSAASGSVIGTGAVTGAAVAGTITATGAAVAGTTTVAAGIVAAPVVVPVAATIAVAVGIGGLIGSLFDD